MRVTVKERLQYKLACVTGLWLLKGMCIGFGVFFGWRLGMLILGRLCHAN